mgnify:CR=1 FL=1
MNEEDARTDEIMDAGGLEVYVEDPGKSREKRKWKKPVLIGTAALFLIICFAGIGYAFFRGGSPKGYQDYVVQKEQYFVEYSEEYDYWDVLTIEYPVLDGIDSEVQEQINEQMYETAMDRTNYWHFHPNDEVKAFQEDQFSIFCSDVTCDVTYHSQYLLSMDFYELYSAGHPLWNTNITERGLTADLLTGEVYALTDILEINRDFIDLWDACYCERTGEEGWNDEEREMVLSWFLQEDEELKENYESRPFFYVTENREFVIGLSLDPLLYAAITYEPTERILCTAMNAEELAPFKTQSEFWDRYERSETAGEVLPCEDKQENIWLGEEASVWNWDY